MLESALLLKLKLALYTAGSAIALTGAVRMLVLPHAVMAGASLYIEQKNLIRGSHMSKVASTCPVDTKSKVEPHVWIPRIL